MFEPLDIEDSRNNSNQYEDGGNEWEDDALDLHLTADVQRGYATRSHAKLPLPYKIVMGKLTVRDTALNTHTMTPMMSIGYIRRKES